MGPDKPLFAERLQLGTRCQLVTMAFMSVNSLHSISLQFQTRIYYFCSRELCSRSVGHAQDTLVDCLLHDTGLCSGDSCLSP